MGAFGHGLVDAGVARQEGKQVFRDLTVHGNLRVGLRARRSRGDTSVLDELYERFPVLGERRTHVVTDQVDELLGGIADDVVVLDRGRVTLRDDAANVTAEAIAESIYSPL